MANVSRFAVLALSSSEPSAKLSAPHLKSGTPRPISARKDVKQEHTGQLRALVSLSAQSLMSTTEQVVSPGAKHQKASIGKKVTVPRSVPLELTMKTANATQGVKLARSGMKSPWSVSQTKTVRAPWNCSKLRWNCHSRSGHLLAWRLIQLSSARQPVLMAMSTQATAARRSVVKTLYGSTGPVSLAAQKVKSRSVMSALETVHSALKETPRDPLPMNVSESASTTKDSVLMQRKTEHAPPNVNTDGSTIRLMELAQNSVKTSLNTTLMASVSTSAQPPMSTLMDSAS